MKIIKQSWEFLNSGSVVDALHLIEAAGRTCYKSEDKMTEESAPNFVRRIIKSGHHSVLEHFNISVRIITDRGCYDEDTEVLTQNGWKHFKDVSEQDLFACLDDNGELFFDKATDFIVKPVDGPMLKFLTSSVDLLVTPDHNMWVFDYDKRSPETRQWKFIKATQMNNGRYKVNKRAEIWRGNDTEVTIPAHPTKHRQFPEISLPPDKTAHLFELLGLWVTDGSYRIGNGSGSSIQISQTKPIVRARIEELCQLLGFSTSWVNNECRIDNGRLVRFVESLFGAGAKTFTAKVPQIIKDASSWQIQRFLDGVIAGDGNIHKDNGHIVVYTSSPIFAGDLQELFLKTSKSANIRTIAPRDRTFPSGSTSKCQESYVVSVHGFRRSVHLLNKKSAKSFGEPVEYHGNVYCVTVPYHRLYVRRNGKTVWCGNCTHEIVRHRLASYSQESTRYCNYSQDKFGKEITVILPVWFEELANQKMAYADWIYQKMAYADWVASMTYAESVYFRLLGYGQLPQQARSVLPNSLKTEIVMTCNIREWRHFFTLRTSAAAHPQMKDLATSMLKGFQEAMPVFFEDLG